MEEEGDVVEVVQTDRLLRRPALNRLVYVCETAVPRLRRDAALPGWQSAGGRSISGVATAPPWVAGRVRWWALPAGYRRSCLPCPQDQAAMLSDEACVRKALVKRSGLNPTHAQAGVRCALGMGQAPTLWSRGGHPISARSTPVP